MDKEKKKIAIEFVGLMIVTTVFILSSYIEGIFGYVLFYGFFVGEMTFAIDILRRSLLFVRDKEINKLIVICIITSSTIIGSTILSTIGVLLNLGAINI